MGRKKEVNLKKNKKNTENENCHKIKERIINRET